MALTALRGHSAALKTGQTKKPRPEIRPWLYLKTVAGNLRLAAIRRKPFPEIGAKIESRGAGRTIASSRCWLNAFFFGVRLAWLSPFSLG